MPAHTFSNALAVHAPDPRIDFLDKVAPVLKCGPPLGSPNALWVNLRRKDPVYTVWLGTQKIGTFPRPLTHFAHSDPLGEGWWVSRCFGGFLGVLVDF